MSEKMESAGASCIPEAECCQPGWRYGGPPPTPAARWRTERIGRVSLWGRLPGPGPLFSGRRAEPWPVWGPAAGSPRAWSGGPGEGTSQTFQPPPPMRLHTSMEPCTLATLKNGLRLRFLEVVSGGAGPLKPPKWGTLGGAPGVRRDRQSCGLCPAGAVCSEDTVL